MLCYPYHQLASKWTVQFVMCSLCWVALYLSVAPISQAANIQSSTKDIRASLTPAKTKAANTLDEVSSRISALEKVDAPDTAQKSELTWLYQARDFLQKSLTSIEHTLDYYQTYQGVPIRLKRLEQELGTPLPTEFKVDSRQSLQQLEQQLESARIELETAQNIRNEIENEATQRSERLQRISDESAGARKRLEELNQLLAAPSSTNGGTSNEAKQTTSQVEQEYLNLLLLELEQEQRSYENRRELLRARRQQAERQVLVAKQRFHALEQHVNELRVTAAVESMQAADTAILAASRAHPLVRTIVDENQQLATELAQVSALSTNVSVLRKKLQDSLSTTHRQYEGIKEKIAQIGLTDAIGLKLRNDRNQLPDSSSLSAALQTRRAEVNRVQLRRIEIEDQLILLVDVKREALRQISALETSATTLNETENRALENALQYALGQQKDKYLNELIKAYDIYFEKHLYPMMESERELIALVGEYDEFIDTRILWIQSSPPLGFSEFNHLGRAIAWLLNPIAFAQTLDGLRNDLIANPVTVGIPLIAVALLVGFYRRLKEKLSALGRYVTKLSKAKFSDTLLAAIVTALMVLPWPLLIYLLAWRINLSSQDNVYANASSSGLFTVAYLLFLSLLLQRICRPDGLGESHFRWKIEHLTQIRKQLTWFLPTALPLAFIVTATMAQPTQAHHDSLGRAAFISLMLMSSLLIYKLLKPSTGLLKNAIEKDPGGWLDRLSGVWFPILLTTPLALAIASAIGYFYTAIQLWLYVINTLSLIFVISIIREFFIRWLNIAQRKIALDQWRKKIAAQAQAIEKSENPEGIESNINEEPELDVGALSTQTMRLLDSAFWITIIIGVMLIWSEVLPALNLLNEVVLWSSEVTSGEGAASVTTQTPTTLVNALLALTILH